MCVAILACHRNHSYYMAAFALVDGIIILLQLVQLSGCGSGSHVIKEGVAGDDI